MPKQFNGDKHKQNFRPNEKDWTLITKLGSKLGLKFSNIVRLALRLLAEKEGL